MKKSQEYANLAHAPVLIKLFRGTDRLHQPIIECVHHGIVSVVDGHGKVVLSYGDDVTKIHMRSCAKPFQILPLFEQGIVNDTSDIGKALKPYDIALLMSSHSGEHIHTERVAELLQLIGLDHHALRCGVHPPQDPQTRQELIQNHQMPSELHNNCSGKHVAMLFMCHKNGFDRNSYEKEDHPLQVWIKRHIAKLADLNPVDIDFGIDGCSLPSFVIPLKNLALMYARLAYFQGHLPHTEPSWLSSAFAKLWQSATTYPEYVAGHNRFDTELIRAAKGAILSKTGADGMQAISIAPCKEYPLGLGIAIKIADGDAKQTIRPLVVKYVLKQLNLWPDSKALDRFMPSFKNYRGLITGGALYEMEIQSNTDA